MGYGYGPGMSKPGKKITPNKPSGKPTNQDPVVENPEVPEERIPNMSPLPFDLDKLFNNKWKRP